MYSPWLVSSKDVAHMESFSIGVSSLRTVPQKQSHYSEIYSYRNCMCCGDSGNEDLTVASVETFSYLFTTVWICKV
jgi:hypothetical protein